MCPACSDLMLLFYHSYSLHASLLKQFTNGYDMTWRLCIILTWLDCAACSPKLPRTGPAVEERYASPRLP